MAWEAEKLRPELVPLALFAHLTDLNDSDETKKVSLFKGTVNHET